jgi:hypothetical protein
MKPMHRIALAASAVLLALTPAAATHSWGGYHWAGDGTQLNLRVNTAITAQWSTSVGNAIADWDKSSELALTGPVTAAVDARRCNPIAGQILVCNAAYGRRGWLGIASIWIDAQRHIVQGTTKLNDSYHNYAPYNSASWRSLVACQEIGHDFGLDHQDETFGNVNLGTCMDYTNAPAGGVYNGFDYGPSNEHLNAHDYDMLKTIYNHNDGYTTAAASTNFGIRQVGGRLPQAALVGIGDSAAEWGRPIHRDGLGRPDVFLKDFGGGNRALTHVFWAIGEGPR